MKLGTIWEHVGWGCKHNEKHARAHYTNTQTWDAITNSNDDITNTQ